VTVVRAKETKNLKDKIVGLIGKKPYALLIKTHFGIHTFGLKSPIDVLILDENNKVVSVKKSLAPNRIFVWNPMYKKVLELPSGTISKKKIKIKSVVRLLASDSINQI
jgi:hypothetical protein